MSNQNVSTVLRRSSRVPTALPILVTSLEGTHFSEVCETMVVNAHGCAMLSPVKLEKGVPLRFHSKDGRETTAYVVSCQPIDSDNGSWKLGARLDQPENFWGLNECPDDWGLPAGTLSGKVSSAGNGSARKASSQVKPPSGALLEVVVRQLEGPVQRMVAEAVRPLQAEITTLTEKLARREANPNRFEVSLSSIPPELEQQIEVRLRKDIAPKALEEARQQYAHLLAAAKTTIDQRTNEGYEQFLRKVAGELQAVEKRAQVLSTQINDNTQTNLQRGLQDFRQKLVDGGNSLKRLSEELVQFLQQNLNDEHNARRGDLEKLRSAVASESARLREEVGHLDRRIAKLDESAGALESGLDQRLSQLSSHTVKETRSQLDSVAGGILQDLTVRGGKTIGSQLDEASENMKLVQKGVIASASESLKAQAASALQSFEHSMAELAGRSLEGFRRKLVSGLNAVVNSFGERFQSGAESSGDGKQP